MLLLLYSQTITLVWFGDVCVRGQPISSPCPKVTTLIYGDYYDGDGGGDSSGMRYQLFESAVLIVVGWGIMFAMALVDVLRGGEINGEGGGEARMEDGENAGMSAMDLVAKEAQREGKGDGGWIDPKAAW